MSGFSRRRSRGGPAPTHATRDSGEVDHQPATSGGEERKRGGILGWFQDAGDWVADRYDDVAEGIGNAVETTKRVASDVWDVVETTDVSWDNGKVGVETDLDEVLDLMPESVREKIQLGDGAENRIALTYDTENNTLNASSADLEIEGMDLAGLQSGAASFKDVSVDIRNPGDALSMLESPREWLGDDEDGVQIDVSVGSGQAENLRIPGEEGGTSIARAAFTDFTGSASNADGLPFGEEARGTAARFAAGGLQLSGVNHQGADVGSVDLSDVAGGLSERDETAWLEVGSVSAAEVDDGSGASVDTMGARDVRVDVRNEGGGMVLLDDVDDHMNATVTASSATVGGVETMGARAGAARIGGLNLTADQDTKSLDLAAASVTGADLASGESTLGTLDAGGLNAHLSPGDWSAELERGAVTDAALFGWEADEASLAGLSAGNDGSGPSGTLDRASLRGLRGDDVSVGSATLSDLSGAKTADGWNATVGSGEAAEVDAMGASIGQARLAGATATSTGDRLEGSLDQLSLRDASGMGGSADAATLRRLAASKDAEGWEAGLAGATVEGASYDKYRLADGAVSGVSARSTADGIQADIGRLSADGMRTTEGSAIDHAHAGDLSLRTSAGGIDANAGTVGVRGVDLGEVGLREGTLTGAGARITEEGTSLGADQVALSGFTAKDFEAGSLSASDASAELGHDRMSGRVADAAVTDARYGELAVDRAALTDASGSVAGDRRSTTIAGLDAHGLRYGDDLSVASASVRGIAGSSEGDAFRGTVEAATANTIAAGDLTVGQASLDAARFASDGTTHDAHANRIEASDAAMGDTAGLSALAIYGASGQTDGTETFAGADRLDAAGLRFSTTPGEGDGGPSGLDGNALIRSLSRRVDDADLRASVPMAAGTYDAGVELGVPHDTRMTAGLSVRDNQIADLDARFSRGLDGPAWTELRGMYDDNGRVKADVAGWFDKDLTRALNEGVGLHSNRLAPLATYGDAIASGGGESGTSDSEHPSLATAFDTSRLQAEGHVHLSPGTLDAGMGQLTLGAGGSGANTLTGRAANGQASLSAGALVVDSSNARVGDARVGTGDALIEGTRIDLDTAGADAGSMDGSVERLSVEDLHYRK